MDSGSSLYLPSMYDSFDEDDEEDTFGSILDETRDDHIKVRDEDDQQRRGSRYALLRSLAWSQDEDLEEECEDRVDSSNLTDASAMLYTLVASICTISAQPASEETTKNKRDKGRSCILWEQQVPSNRDLATIVCQRQKQ